jgi:DNA repair protein RadA/Sms
MARTDRRDHRSFQCRACGAQLFTWAGQCNACHAWATVEEATQAADAAQAGWSGGVAVRLGEVDRSGSPAVPTGIDELDRVLGGGLVPGSVSLLGGEPGIGKSTLLLQLGAAAARDDRRVLYVSGEEMPAQVRRRADRLRVGADAIWVVGETDLARVDTAIAETRPELLLIDSVQTLTCAEASGAAGSVSQVRECAQQLVARAKAGGPAVVIVGHVTKDGALAGPRTLEHVVDTVLSFEGDRHETLRTLRTVKHRFGPTDQVGIFEMTAGGLVAVADPSGLYLAERRADLPGSAVVPLIQGHRPVLVEIQALVVPLDNPTAARRSAKGVDAARLGLVVAVLDRLGGVPVTRAEVYALAAGGARAGEPGADLGLALAVVSALAGRALPADLVAVGELGLTGEVRSVPQLERRLQEAARMGFRRAVVPPAVLTSTVDLELLAAPTVHDAVAVALRGAELAMAAGPP